MINSLSQRLVLLLVGVFAFSGCVSLVAAEPDANARDLTILTTWFEGEFDNDSQLWFEADRRWTGTEDDKHQRNHATHKRVTAPAIGEHVFFVEEYLDNDASTIWRRRLVNFESDKKDEIRMRIYFLKNSKDYDARNTEYTFDDITAAEVMNLPECDVFFKRVGEQYEGHMRVKKCQFGDGDELRYSEHDMIISKNQYWRIDRTRLVSNDEIFKGEKSSVPMKMRKARIYNCDINMPYISYAEPSPKDIKMKGLRVHNQGGQVEFLNPKTNKTTFLQLREKEYPYYKEGSDFFLMRIKEEGAVRSLALVTTAPNPERLSANVGGISASCKRLEE